VFKVFSPKLFAGDKKARKSFNNQPDLILSNGERNDLLVCVFITVEV
jgi:hypothetical protein